VHEFLTEIPGRNSVTFIVTMNNLSVTGLSDLLQGILALRETYSKTYQRIWFDTPVLRQPAWQSLQILPESYAEKLQHVQDWMQTRLESESTRFRGFKDYEINRLDRDIAWMRDGQKSSATDLARNKADFFRFFNEHDRRRGTDFLKTFPEMAAWWAECEYYAKKL